MVHRGSSSWKHLASVLCKHRWSPAANAIRLVGVNYCHSTAVLFPEDTASFKKRPIIPLSKARNVSVEKSDCEIDDYPIDRTLSRSPRQLTASCWHPLKLYSHIITIARGKIERSSKVVQDREPPAQTPDRGIPSDLVSWGTVVFASLCCAVVQEKPCNVFGLPSNQCGTWFWLGAGSKVELSLALPTLVAYLLDQYLVSHGLLLASTNRFAVARFDEVVISTEP